MARIAIDFDVNDGQAVAAVNRVKGSIGSVQPPHPAAAQGFTSLHDRILETTGALQKMARVLVSVQVIMATAVALLGVKQIIEAADAWTNMASRLSLVTQSSADLIAVQDRLFRLAQEIRLPIEDVVKLYTRLAQNSQELGVNQAQLFAITKVTSQAMQISGATAGEAASGVLQFTQAIASNNLAGDELKALMENSPRLIKAVGDGLRQLSPEFDKLTKSGMGTIGAIRALAKKGQLDAGIILEALLSQMQIVDSEFGRLARTIGQAWTQVTNQLQAGIKHINTQPLLTGLDRVRAWFADPSTQHSMESFANGVLSALGSMADKIPAIVAFIQGHAASLATDIQTLSPFLSLIGEWLSKIANEFLSLPPGVQQLGLIAAFLTGTTGIAVGLLAMDVGYQLGIVYNRLKQIVGLYDPGQEASLVRARGLIEELKKAGTSFNDRDLLAPPRDYRQEGGTTRLDALLKAQADEAAALAAGIKRNAATNNDAARMAAAKRLEEEMKVAKLVNDIHLDQAQFEKDQAVKTTDFLSHENKRQYETYAQDEAQFIERELTLLEVRKDQELALLEESRANVRADLALKLRAIQAHAADKKALEDPGLTKIKRNEAELQAFKQSQDLDQKALDLKRQTEENKIKIVEAAQDRITKIVAEASGARVQREIADLDKALKQVERGSAAEIALQAEKLEKIQAFNRQALEYAANVAEQQARLAGDIDAAYSIGFAEAATKADDAFTAMRKSGAEAFQSLKSGLSDFLFDMFTGAKSIGDVFVNLGKRILRSFTDVFAEILAKQMAMSAGFSLTGFLGLGTAVAGAAGMEGAPNAAAQAITGLGTAATGSADALSGMTGILGLVMRVLTMFGNGLMGILGFFGQIVQGIASGGGIVNTLTNAFGTLVSAGSSLMSVFSGLSTVGGTIMNAFQGVGGLADVFQSVFNAVGWTSGGFASAPGAVTSWGAATSATGGAPLTASSLAGQYATFLAEWVPIVGALTSAAFALKDIAEGKLVNGIGSLVGGIIGAVVGTIFFGQTAIGYAIGSIVGAKAATAFEQIFKGKVGDGLLMLSEGIIGPWMRNLIGGTAGKVIEGLINPMHFFTKTVFGWLGWGTVPKATLSAGITPFDRNAIGADVIGTGGLPGTQVGAGLVDIGGNIMKNKKERALQEALAAMINDLLIQVVDAAVLMMKTLPPAISAQLDAALTQLETIGLEIVDKKWKGGNAAKKFSKRVKGLMEETLQDLVTALDFGDVDLKALGFDPEDKKGKKGGEVARGFEAMMMALGGLSAIVKEVGPAVDLSSVSLAQFTKGAIDLFKGFATEGEAFTDTITRVMQTFGEIIALKDQIHTSLAAVSGDLTEVVGIIKAQMANAEASMVSMVDALTVAIESGAKPEEVLAAAKAAAQAVTDTLKMEIDAVTSLHDAVLRLNTAITGGVDLIVSLTQRIDALRGTELSAGDLQFGLDGLKTLWSQLTDVTSRIALFAAGIAGLSENLALGAVNIPLVVAAFNEIMVQIQEMSDPATAVAALKDLAGAVESGLQAAVAAVNRQTQARIAALDEERVALAQANTLAKEAIEAQKTGIIESFDAQRSALEAQKSLATEGYDAQETALQTALSLSQQWVSVLQSVKAQLVDLFNLLAPTHPLTSLNEIQAQFNAAFAAFQASPTAEGATQVQDLARQLLQLAQQTPGYDLPSTAFQELAATVRAALESIQTFAASQPSQEAIQAQITALNEQQAASLASIDTQIQALDEQQAAQLAAIDAQIQTLDDNQAAALASIDTQIAQANADGQAAIQYLQELAAQGLEAIRAQLVIEATALAAQQAQAADALQKVIGEKTFEQFVAEKQKEAADLLRGIDETLQSYLGDILRGLGFPATAAPSHAEGLAYVPYDNYTANLHRGERVLTASENSSYGSTKGGGSSTVTITLAPTIQIQGGSSSQMKSDLDKALVELVNGPSLTRPALLELAKRAS